MLDVRVMVTFSALHQKLSFSVSLVLKIGTVCLEAHQQTSKKRCFEKYCSCDKECQFLALLGTPDGDIY